MNYQRAREMFIKTKVLKAKQTRQAYESVLRLFGEHIDYKWPFDEFDIEGYLADCKERDLSLATISNYWRHIKAFCNWLHRRGVIERNPIDYAEAPPKYWPLPQMPPEENIMKVNQYLLDMMDKCPDYQHVRDYALFALLLDAGLRINEALHLTLADVDLDSRQVILRETKSRADGVSVFGPDAAYWLEKWLAVRADLPLPTELSHWVFVSYYNGQWYRFTNWGFGQLIKRVCKKIGIPPFKTHALRHACAILAIRQGSDFLDVQHQLRHRTPQMTMRYLMVTGEGRARRYIKHSPFARINGGA